jgi:sugar phosphate isomerase/epimerase
VIISACSDEISTDLALALDTLEREAITHVDLRGIWGGNVIALTDEQAAQAHHLLQERGFSVTALSTPIGKTDITADFELEVARFKRALELADRLAAPYLRLFSFYVSAENAEQYRPEALRRLQYLCELAQPYGIVLAHENEEGGFCAWRPEECLAFHQALPDNFRALFEPCSFTVMGYDPYTEALPLLRPYLAYLHVRDTKSGSTQYGVVGEGDVGWPELLADLQSHNFKGYLTLEPHLGWGSPTLTDEMRAQNFSRAAKALREALATL